MYDIYEKKVCVKDFITLILTYCDIMFCMRRLQHYNIN